MANISLVNTSWDRKVILILITMLCYIHGAPYGLHGSSTSLACSLLTTMLCGRNCYDLFISCKSRVPDAPHIYLLSSAGFSGERTPSGNICARSLLVISPRNDIHWGWAGTGPGRGISWAAVKFVIKASGDPMERALEVGWPFRVVLNWASVAGLCTPALPRHWMWTVPRGDIGSWVRPLPWVDRDSWSGSQRWATSCQHFW